MKRLVNILIYFYFQKEWYLCGLLSKVLDSIHYFNIYSCVNYNNYFVLLFQVKAAMASFPKGLLAKVFGSFVDLACLVDVIHVKGVFVCGHIRCYPWLSDWLMALRWATSDLLSCWWSTSSIVTLLELLV